MAAIKESGGVGGAVICRAKAAERPLSLGCKG